MPKTIFIVEDDIALQDIFEMMLLSEGYDVKIIADPGSIFTEPHNTPDLYLLDMLLSGVDGLDICRRLKSNQATKHIPIVMISANPDITKLASQAGADAAIEKPFIPNFFFSTIAHCLNNAVNPPGL